MGWIALRKKEIKDGVVYYYYQRIKDGEWGILFVDTKNNQNGWEKLAEGDPADLDIMRQHAYSLMWGYCEKGEYPETDYRAYG